MLAVLFAEIVFVHPAEARLVIVIDVAPPFASTEVLKVAEPALVTVKTDVAPVAVFAPDRL